MTPRTLVAIEKDEEKRNESKHRARVSRPDQAR